MRHVARRRRSYRRRQHELAQRMTLEYELLGGPLDGAHVEGPPVDTRDGRPDAIRLEGGGEYVRGDDHAYLWRDEPLEGGGA